MDKDVSLRSRKSTGPQGRRPAPRQGGQGGARLAKPGAGRTPRDGRKQSSRVDDKIKKRMTMRYADITSPTELNAPAMPMMPVALRRGRGKAGREQDEMVKDRTGEARFNDNQLLDTDDFDPDACTLLVSENLADV